MRHRLVFGRDVFATGSRWVADVLREGGGRRVLVFLEQGVERVWPDLGSRIIAYFQGLEFDFRGLHLAPGGEAVKADDSLVRRVWEEIDRQHIDRHSYLLVIGGGAFLDAVGFAAATAHRGVRLVRFPTTTLSQDDSGVGVKCAINAFGKKNWIGSFAVPWAVINDFSFLHLQDPAMRGAGLVEAVKVAVVKDPGFFDWIEQHASALAAGDPPLLEQCVERSALLHARHIAEGGDPFEAGSSRPLDFGHWAAHKLEQLSGFRLAHAHAVATGMALDTLYAANKELLAMQAAERVLDVISRLGLPVWNSLLESRDPAGRLDLFAGLEDFREHLGGKLTVLLPVEIGRAVDVHEMDPALIAECIALLRGRAPA